MFFSLTLLFSLSFGSIQLANAQSALSQSAKQCVSAAGVIHHRKDAPAARVDPGNALAQCRSAREEADRAGHVVQFAVGRAFMTSHDTREVQVGLTLVERAAEAGLPQALYRMGALYEEGFFKQRDRCTDFNDCRARDRRHAETAVSYFAKAAPKYGPAASALGYAYYYGAHGIRRNLGTAEKYLSAAADAGIPAAMRLLGPMYMDGHGVPQDKARGLELVGLAAQMNDRQSQELIGDYALAGNGMVANHDLAIAWYRKAARSGSTIAADKLKRLGASEWTTGQALLGITIAGIVLMTLTPDGPEGKARAERALKGPDCVYPWMRFDAYSCIHAYSGVVP